MQKRSPLTQSIWVATSPSLRKRLYLKLPNMISLTREILKLNFKMTGDCRLDWPYLSDLDIIGNIFSSFRTRVLVMLNLVKGDNFRTKTKADARHGRSLLIKTGTGVNSTHEGACSRSTLLQLAPGANCTNDFYRKNKLRNKTFAPSYETGLIWGSKLQGQVCCTSLFQEQAPLCVLKFACRDMTCLQLANQIGFFFSSRVPIRLFHHSAPSSCPSCVLCLG